MIRTTLIASIAAGALALASCAPADQPAAPTTRDVQARAAATAANTIRFSRNAEIENITKRLQLTGNPDLLGFIVLLNEAGQPIMYTSVKGKVTSGGKRLTRVDVREDDYEGDLVRQAPSDEGTYGSSAPYIFFWTTDGQYIQWDGGYLYSDQPFRLNTQPLIVKVLDQESIDATRRAGEATARAASSAPRPVATAGATTTN